MDKKIVKSLVSAVALSGAAYAGPVVAEAPDASSSCGDWCSSITNLGKPVYEGSGFINSIKFASYII